jgi:hypothetical protein
VIITLGETNLCDGWDRAVNKSTGPTQFHLSAPISVQLAEYLRATFAVPIARGNAKPELSFSVHHLSETVSDSERWMFEHVLAVPRSGTMTLTPDSGGSGITLANAVLDNPQFTFFGCTIIVQYHLLSGTITVA